MKPSEERLKWLIEDFLEAYKPEDFGTQEKPARLKDWEILKIADELKQFIASPGMTCFVRNDEKKKLDVVSLDKVTIDKDQIAGLRFDLGVAIGEFTERGPATPEGSYLFSLLPTRTGPLGCFSVPRDVEISYHEGFPHSIVAIGGLSGLSRLSLAFVLKETGTDKIAQCLECPRFFFKVRSSQKYCSKTCINRVSQREWRKKPENRDKESESAHGRYKRRVQKGRTVKVDRRPHHKPKGKE
jgi:hypothetical protein